MSKNTYMTWGKPMSSREAERYFLTRGFVAAELYEAEQAENEKLKAQLSTARSQSAHYRDALRGIYNKLDNENDSKFLFDHLFDIARAALDRGPEEPVTKGEIVKALDEVGAEYQPLNLLESFADAILKTFRVERR